MINHEIAQEIFKHAKRKQPTWENKKNGTMTSKHYEISDEEMYQPFQVIGRQCAECITI